MLIMSKSGNEGFNVLGSLEANDSLHTFPGI